MADRTDPATALATRVGYDPAADLARRYPDWLVVAGDLGGLVAEVFCPARRVILLDGASDVVVQRCSLAHAVAHLDLDHTHRVQGHFENREEAAANDLAARRLVPVEAYAAALAWTRERAEIGSELMVDAATLRIREAGFTRGERQLLRRVGRRFAESA